MLSWEKASCLSSEYYHPFWGSMKNNALLPMLLELENFFISSRARAIVVRNPLIGTCWQMLDCTKKRCPVYGKLKARCWQIHGTFCNAKTSRGDVARKWKDCRECRVFREATATPEVRIKEAISNICFSMTGYRGNRQDIMLYANVGRAARQYSLTSRESQILAALLNRYGRTQIAQELGVSPETVKAHIRNIYKKAKVHARRELAEQIQKQCAP